MRHQDNYAIIESWTWLSLCLPFMLSFLSVWYFLIALIFFYILQARGKNTHHHPIVIVPRLIFRSDRNDYGLWRWLIQLWIFSYLDPLKFKVDQKQNCQCHAKREPWLEPVHQTLFKTTRNSFVSWNTQKCMLRPSVSVARRCGSLL